MKFLIQEDPKGAYTMPNGVPVNVVPADHGKDYADQAAFLSAFKIVTRDAYIATQTAISKAKAAFDAALKKGYSDTTLAISIAIEDEDRAQFDALETHLTRKAEPDDTVITIKLLDGTPHQLTCGQFRDLVIRAGDYYLSLWTSLQTTLAGITNPTPAPVLAPS